MKNDSNISSSSISDAVLDTGHIDILNETEISMLAVVGHVLMCHQQTDEAISIFEAMHFIDPEDRYPMRALVHLYIELERFSDALDLSNKHKLADPKETEINNIFGLLESKILWSLGREKEARLSFNEYRQKASIVK